MAESENGEIPNFTEEERLVAIDVFGLVFGIDMYRSLQTNPTVPTYAKDIRSEELLELQERLSELTADYPDVVRQMNLRIDSLVGITPIEDFPDQAA